MLAVGYICVVLALISMVNERPFIAMIGLYTLTYLSVMVVIYLLKWRGEIEDLKNRRALVVQERDLSPANEVDSNRESS
jgi:hypothetical protein